MYGPFDNFDLVTSHVLPADDPQVPPRQGTKPPHHDPLGHRLAPARVPPLRRPRRSLPPAPGHLQRNGAHQRGQRHGRNDQRTRPDSSRTRSATKARSNGTPPSPTAPRASSWTACASAPWAGSRASASPKASPTRTDGSWRTAPEPRGSPRGSRLTPRSIFGTICFQRPSPARTVLNDQTSPLSTTFVCLIPC